MKRLVLSFLLLLSFFHGVSAQNYTGTWVGTLTSLMNNNDVVSTVVTIRANEIQFSGEYWIEFKGAKDKYTMQGTIENNTATGTATYPVDGTVFQVEALLQNGQLVFAIGLAGIPILAGTLSRQTKTSDGVTTLKRAIAPASSEKVLKASGVAGQWEQAFRGRRLLYLRTKNGMRSEWYYDLCDNGMYVYRNSSSYSSGDFLQPIADAEQGTWRVVMRDNVPYLVCSPQNKDPYEKQIQALTEGQVSLHGQRYFLDRNKSCQ